MTLYETILEALKELSTAEQVEINNEYADTTNYSDNYVYLMDEIDEILHGKSPMDIIEMVKFVFRFNPSDDYFRFNVYGDLESFNRAEDYNSNIDLESIANFIVENKDALMNAEIQQILDEYEEEEEEEEEEEK